MQWRASDPRGGRHGRAHRGRTAHRVALWPNSPRRGGVRADRSGDLIKPGRSRSMGETGSRPVPESKQVGLVSSRWEISAPGLPRWSRRLSAKAAWRSASSQNTWLGLPSPAASSKPTMPANGINESLSRYSIRKRSTTPGRSKIKAYKISARFDQATQAESRRP